jgi:hypothetical protein
MCAAMAMAGDEPPEGCETVAELKFSDGSTLVLIVKSPPIH